MARGRGRPRYRFWWRFTPENHAAAQEACRPEIILTYCPHADYQRRLRQGLNPLASWEIKSGFFAWYHLGDDSSRLIKKYFGTGKVVEDRFLPLPGLNFWHSEPDTKRLMVELSEAPGENVMRTSAFIEACRQAYHSNRFVDPDPKFDALKTESPIIESPEPEPKPELAKTNAPNLDPVEMEIDEKAKSDDPLRDVPFGFGHKFDKNYLAYIDEMEVGYEEYQHSIYMDRIAENYRASPQTREFMTAMAKLMLDLAKAQKSKVGYGQWENREDQEEEEKEQNRPRGRGRGR